MGVSIKEINVALDVDKKARIEMTCGPSIFNRI